MHVSRTVMFTASIGLKARQITAMIVLGLSAQPAFKPWLFENITVHVLRTVMFTAPHRCLMMVLGLSAQPAFNPASSKATQPGLLECNDA
jgi:hypothetical protein